MKYGNKILRKYLSPCTRNFPISDYISLSHKVICNKLKLCYIDIEKNPRRRSVRFKSVFLFIHVKYLFSGSEVWSSCHAGNRSSAESNPKFPRSYETLLEGNIAVRAENCLMGRNFNLLLLTFL